MLILDLDKALGDVTRQWLEAYNSHNFAKVSSYYTEDCKVLPPGSPVAAGREGERRISCNGF